MRDEQFLPITRAALVLGIDRGRVRELIARGDLPAYDDVLDRRRPLVSTTDLARLHQPRRRRMPQRAPAVA